MKKTASRIWSILLVVALLCGLLPVAAFATGTPMKIVVDSVNTQPGGEVKVAVNVKDNPGIASMKLVVDFDSVLTLTAVEYNDADWGGISQQPQNFANPVTLNWFDGTKNFTASEAVFATLTFTVADDAEEDTKANIVISYDKEDIYNIAEENVECTIVDGVVTVCSLVHGDINGDRQRNNKDVTRMFQYLANWDVKVVEKALDTNNDGSVNNKDMTRLFQFLANWDVELWCDGVLLQEEEECQHNLEKVSYKAPKCEEAGNIEHYWCTLCKKLFNDASASKELTNVTLPALGHSEVDIPSVAPTYDEAGSEGGKKCSACGKILEEPVVLPPLEKTTVNIEYHYEGRSPGAFLMSYVEENDISKYNPNKTEYNTAQKGYTLDPLTNVNAVPGYEFVGWVDGYGNSVTSIAKGEEKNMILYAKWKILTYWVTFDCGENGPEAENIRIMPIAI